MWITIRGMLDRVLLLCSWIPTQHPYHHKYCICLALYIHQYLSVLPFPFRGISGRLQRLYPLVFSFPKTSSPFTSPMLNAQSSSVPYLPLPISCTPSQKQPQPCISIDTRAFFLDCHAYQIPNTRYIHNIVVS